MVETSVLPQVREEAEELSRLPAPSGEGRRVAAILRGLDVAVRKGDAEPVALVGKNAVGPFARVEKLASAYGFGACSDPL